MCITFAIWLVVQFICCVATEETDGDGENGASRQRKDTENYICIKLLYNYVIRLRKHCFVVFLWYVRNFGVGC